MTLSGRIFPILAVLASSLLPPLITAIMALAAGMFAETPGSPLDWAKLIAEREYRQEAALP